MNEPLPTQDQLRESLRANFERQIGGALSDAQREQLRADFDRWMRDHSPVPLPNHNAREPLATVMLFAIILCALATMSACTIAAWRFALS